MNKHELKIWPVHFNNVINGTKTFEIRKNDRAFQKGDSLTLKEFNPETITIYDEDPMGGSDEYEKIIGFTGKEVEFTIGDVYPIDSERVVFSLLKDECRK